MDLSALNSTFVILPGTISTINYKYVTLLLKAHQWLPIIYQKSPNSLLWEYITHLFHIFLIWPSSLPTISLGKFYTLDTLVCVSHTSGASCLCSVHALSSGWNTCSSFKTQFCCLLFKWRRTHLGSCYHQASYISLRLPYVTE